MLAGVGTTETTLSRAEAAEAAEAAEKVAENCGVPYPVQELGGGMARRATVDDRLAKGRAPQIATHFAAGFPPFAGHTTVKPRVVSASASAYSAASA